MKETGKGERAGRRGTSSRKGAAELSRKEFVWEHPLPLSLSSLNVLFIKCVSIRIPHNIDTHSFLLPIHPKKNQPQRTRTRRSIETRRTTSLPLPSAYLPFLDKSMHDLSSFHSSSTLRTPLHILALVWCRTDLSFDFYDPSNSIPPPSLASSPSPPLQDHTLFPSSLWKSTSPDLDPFSLPSSSYRDLR